MKSIDKPRLLILGCGDVGMRLLSSLRDRYRIFAVTRQLERGAEIRAGGAIPIVADLDTRYGTAQLARLAPNIIHLVPPQSEGELDRRTRHLVGVLPRGARVVYLSTTGVYGDCGGEMVNETRPVRPLNGRAKRRVDAERVLRAWARRQQGRLSILRVPGIYAANRLPIERLKQGTPALSEQDDVFTNHIHADDLVRIIVQALTRGAPNRVYHATDDTEMKMGEYFETVARAFQLPLPPRLPREQLKQTVSPMLWSFMSESRRLCNDRIKAELGVRLRYPQVCDALKAMPA